MGSEETAEEASSTPRLPLFTVPTTVESPERSGTVTPPLHTSAAVPFRWEEEPGKPRPCTALIALPTTTTTTTSMCRLELPPRLQLVEAAAAASKMTKAPSPTTVLDGPYPPLLLLPSSSSFRFKGRGSTFGNRSPERGQLGAMVLGGKSKSKSKSKRPPEERKGSRGGLFGSSWGRKAATRLGGKGEGGGGSLVFSYSIDITDFGPGSNEEAGTGSASARMMTMKKKKKTTKTKTKTPMTRQGRSHSHLSAETEASSSSRIWATIREGFKQVLPWSKKPKKEGS
ncbi:uncharacterized protein At4g00950-like isoform X2 [Diospyros lotus]|uniref:uncharacterized protein At4g00950-like isoform X2 n=1 Tax=Diospyros lotus TaxID=55363 RepID=UPI0022553458|nr:uncharacterized protein At4g00950-like isoform X2 [Diospyros lotus]